MSWLTWVSLIGAVVSLAGVFYALRPTFARWAREAKERQDQYYKDMVQGIQEHYEQEAAAEQRRAKAIAREVVCEMRRQNLV